MPDARLQFQRETFENFLQGNLNSFAAAVIAGWPLMALMAVAILVSAGVESCGS
jgi:chromosomal replication initiation ATPase DnaA